MKSTASFTLIELMAASAVLSVVLLMMVGMQDQMSRAWANANRRTDATREASAACRLMAQDLGCLIFRHPGGNSVPFDENKSLALSLRTYGIPFLYSSNGVVPTFSISSNQPNAAYFFGITAKAPSASGPDDYAIVGYYIASGPWTNAQGFLSTNYNLYRYYVPPSDTVDRLVKWLATAPSARTADILFSPDPAKDEILARNTCNLRITAYNRTDGKTKGQGNPVTNGLNYQFVSSGETTFYSGSKLQVEMSAYPEEYAQKLTLTSWATSNNIQRYARSFEFRVDIPRD